MKKPLIVLALLLVSLHASAANPIWQQNKTNEVHQITVYRSATCGCCKGWIDHLKDHNFEVNDVVVDDVNSHKARLGVPPQAASCHTAEVNGVVIEGHVPAQDIKRVISDTTDIRLLTVPAMPSGTPGMDTPGAPKDNFNVYSINKDNKVDIFQSYVNY